MRRREQEVLVAEVGLQAAGGDEVLELCLDLGVGEGWPPLSWARSVKKVWRPET